MTTHATLNGNITDTGGENCDQRGFDWDTDSGAPYANSWTENGSFGTGAFSHQFTGLPNNTRIYFRVKAHNSAGWGYGDEQNFWTWGSVSATDSAVGSEWAAIGQIGEKTATDDAIGTDAASVEKVVIGPVVQDSAIGIEFAWRLKGSCLLDDFELPHVLTIRITDEAVIVDKKLHPPALPRRKMIGKPGRTVEIGGWTRSQTDIDVMDALADGLPHIFIHPSGDTIKVLVRDFNADEAAERYTKRNYRMMLVESR